MGRKKKFIDKKKCATFQLLARDTSASQLPSSDRVFVRVDNNTYSCPQFDEDDGRNHEDADSIFADAPGDTDDDLEGVPQSSWLTNGGAASRISRDGLPDHVRREILELGLPDDGYNYLAHLREIRNAGGGAYYYQNSKAKLHEVPLDVKAYDASKLRINTEVMEDDNGGKDSMYIVASKTRGVRVQKVVDPDIANLLDDDNLSRFGSDVEDLEEDFVVKANLPEVDGSEDDGKEAKEAVFEGNEEVFDVKEEVGMIKCISVRQQEYELHQRNDKAQVGRAENPRVRRLLDEQFDLLALREYDNDSESDDGHHIETEHDLLNFKLENTLKARLDVGFQDKYKDQMDTITGNQELEQDMEFEAPPEVKCKTAEYAEGYLNENEDDKDVTYVEESTDESEVWDCETIISTYSNLDNHPGLIQVPENSRKKIPNIFPGESNSKGNLIALRGKEKLPVEYLPNRKKTVEKVKLPLRAGIEKLKLRPHSQESKEEKKERKAAVKEERREARRAKKELKGLYRFETQRAQKAVAVSGPSSRSLN